jgi:hypothetical protein
MSFQLNVSQVSHTLVSCLTIILSFLLKVSYSFSFRQKFPPQSILIMYSTNISYKVSDS